MLSQNPNSVRKKSNSTTPKERKPQSFCHTENEIIEPLGSKRLLPERISGKHDVAE